MSALPCATRQNPACGACRDETRDEGDRFVCEDCMLAFDPLLLEASFLEPDAEACGSPCDNTWHRDNAITVGIGYDCNPCQLPAGHAPLHWTGCQSKPLAAATEAKR